MDAIYLVRSGPAFDLPHKRRILQLARHTEIQRMGKRLRSACMLSLSVHSTFPTSLVTVAQAGKYTAKQVSKQAVFIQSVFYSLVKEFTLVITLYYTINGYRVWNLLSYIFYVLPPKTVSYSSVDAQAIIRRHILLEYHFRHVSKLELLLPAVHRSTS
ncbi:hypothetical protein Trydic_g2220 [Trypoxylus dichotomus]